MTCGKAHTQTALRSTRCFFQNDVDAAGNSLCTLLGRGGFENFNALNLRRTQLIQIEALRRRVAIDQNLRVART